MDYRGRRATIMGLGHFGGGVQAARWLARRGARVTVTDLATESALAESLDALGDDSIEAFHLGSHREEDFRQADLVVVNPAVRPGNRFLQIAADHGVQLTSETGLFLDACPGRVVAVTGSNGKSTTAAMTAAILRASGRRTFLGGNIGTSLLPQLANIAADDWAVLEISSFQLYHLGQETQWPHVAVVTNCTPNHLDWHGTHQEYTAAKQRLLLGQTSTDIAVLNTQDAEVATWGRFVRGARVPLIPDVELPPLSVPGGHNRINAASAATAAAAVGCDKRAINAGLEAFHALPQRLERFAQIAGRYFYNDSTATTPESTIAALASVERPVWLLAGGRDKGCDFADLVSAVVRYARGAAFFGETGERLHRATVDASQGFASAAVNTMAEALDWCWRRCEPGDAVVLSPACASTDQFRNFRMRGRSFAELAHRLRECP